MKLDERTGKSIDFKLPVLAAYNNMNRLVKFPVTDVQTKSSDFIVSVTTVHKTTIVNIAVENAMVVNHATSPEAEAGDELILVLTNDAGASRSVAFGTGLTAPGGVITGTVNTSATIRFVHNGVGFIEVSRAVTPINY